MFILLARKDAAMRILYLLGLIYTGLALLSCSSIDQPPTTPKPVKPSLSHSKKNLRTISFYTKGKPNVPYEIIGEENISKFNLGGNKRQEAYIRKGMRELAAAMGGDAVIDIKRNTNSITGTVVAYQREDDLKKSLNVSI